MIEMGLARAIFGSHTYLTSEIHLPGSSSSPESVQKSSETSHQQSEQKKKTLLKFFPLSSTSVCSSSSQFSVLGLGLGMIGGET